METKVEIDIDSTWRGDLPYTPPREEHFQTPVSELTDSVIESELNVLYEDASERHSEEDYDTVDYLDEDEGARFMALRAERRRRKWIIWKQSMVQTQNFPCLVKGVNSFQQVSFLREMELLE